MGLDVERDSRIGLAEDRSTGISRPAARAELVKHIRIEPGNIGDRKPRVFEVGEHLHIDVAGEEFPVGSPRVQLAPSGRSTALIAGTKMVS
jgi:hypothetical protein